MLSIPSDMAAEGERRAETRAGEVFFGRIVLDL